MSSLHNKEIGHLISGKLVFDKGNVIDIFNPNTGKQIGFITSAQPQTIEKTIWVINIKRK